jgi:hypothetical protein
MLGLLPDPYAIESLPQGLHFWNPINKERVMLSATELATAANLLARKRLS